jgi:naringenin degradation protein FdeH
LSADHVRLVVTGHDETGKAVVISDAEVTPTDPDFGPKWRIWAADGPVKLPDSGVAPDFEGPLIPGPGGVHLFVLTLPPRFNPDAMVDTSDPVQAAETARQYMAANVAILDDPNPPGTYGTIPGFTGLHATASVDCLMQRSGESVFVLEDREVTLKPGDWLIVNGVVHAWRNDRDEPAVLIAAVVGAEHNGIPRRTG